MARLIPPVNENDHIKGPYNAGIELVEYGDYQCPHCAAAHPLVKAIERTYSNHLKFVFRHFPLSEVHPYAEAAALAAEAASRQEKFWQMHDMIFENQPSLSIGSLLDFAEALDLDMRKFERDIKEQEIAAKVEADFLSGMRSGVNGTPSFFINGQKYNGIYDFNSMAGVIETLMSEKIYR